MDVVRESMASRADAILEGYKAPVYPHPGSYAREHGELEQYRASRRANIACRDAIDRAITENYDGSRLDAEGAKDVARMFGFERTMLVLANTIKVKSWDERISNTTGNGQIPSRYRTKAAAMTAIWIMWLTKATLFWWTLLRGRCAVNIF